MVQTKRLTLGLLYLLGGVFGAVAQQPLSLKQSLEYGLENHPGIQVAKYDIDMSKQRVREGYAPYLPQIGGSFSLDYNLKLQTNIIPGGIFGPEPIQVRFGTKYNAAANLQLDQKIYDQGMIMGFTAYKPSINLSVMQLQQKKEQIAYDIAKAYINVLVVQEQINLLQTNLDSYNKILKVTELQYQKGIVKKTDYDRIRVTVNNLTSQLSLNESNLKVVQNSLKMNMGMDQKTEILLTDTVEFKKMRTEQMPTQFNLENRMDYKALKQSADLRKIQVKMAKAAYVPSISGYARYGAQGLNDDFQNLWKGWFDYSAIGVRVNVPIFDGLAKDARVKQQKITWMSEVKNLDLYKMQFELQYENASVQVQRNRVSVTNDNENLLLAKEVFEQTSMQYQGGVATLSDLINAENAYKEAQTNYINSLLNLRISELDLQKANGTILTYLNIQ